MPVRLTSGGHGVELVAVAVDQLAFQQMQGFGAGVREGRELLAGVIRDQLLNRVPVILRKEIYATAALLGSGIQVLGDALDCSRVWLPWLVILVASPCACCLCAMAGICG